MKKAEKYNFDIHGTDKRFLGYEKRVKKSEMLPDNKKLAIAFKKTVHASGLMGKRRILKYETFFKNYDTLLQKPFNQATKKDLIEVVSKVKDREEWKENTKADFQRCLKRYHKIEAGMEDSSETPELVKWIKVKPVKEKPVSFDSLPDWSDVLKMADACFNHRDKALIKSMWEAGARIGEIMSLRVGDVEEVEHGVYLNIQESKTEPRKVFIRLSAPDILAWINHHPRKNDKENPLFCKGYLNGGNQREVVSHRYIYKMLQRVKNHAKIDKKIHPHMLRHGSASYFSDWLSDSDMDAKYGWVIGSKTKKRYTHKNPKAVESKTLKMAGIGGENGVKNIYLEGRETDVECYYCKKMNPAENKVCFNCRRVLDISMSREIQRLKENIDDINLTYFEENPTALKSLLDYLEKQGKEKIIGKE